MDAHDMKRQKIEIEKGNVFEKFKFVERCWDPHIITSLNQQKVCIAKLEGEFVWHEHENEDEMFFVLEGEMRILFKDKEIKLGPFDYCSIPRGTLHKPVADKGMVKVMLFEPIQTVNTGNADECDLTRKETKKI